MRADRCIQPCIESAPQFVKRPSFIQVNHSFLEGSIPSRLARREIDIVEPDHRKRSGGLRKPTGSVLDRRNLRNPGSVWWYEDTSTNKCARQLVPIRRTSDNTSTGTFSFTASVSADGRFLLYAAATMGKTGLDIWVLSLADPEKRFPLIQREFDQSQGQFSPDGRWVAYVSNESGRSEVLVRGFAAPSDGQTSEPETVIVSSAGGTAPRWRADGKELYFISADGTVVVADVNAGARISFGAPRALLHIPRSHGDWAVLSDGSRFLIAMPAGPDTSAPFTILWNRLAGLGAQPGS